MARAAKCVGGTDRRIGSSRSLGRLSFRRRRLISRTDRRKAAIASAVSQRALEMEQRWTTASSPMIRNHRWRYWSSRFSGIRPRRAELHPRAGQGDAGKAIWLIALFPLDRSAPDLCGVFRHRPSWNMGDAISISKRFRAASAAGSGEPFDGDRHRLRPMACKCAEMREPRYDQQVSHHHQRISCFGNKQQSLIGKLTSPRHRLWLSGSRFKFHGDCSPTRGDTQRDLWRIMATAPSRESISRRHSPFRCSPVDGSASKRSPHRDGCRRSFVSPNPS